MAITTSVSSNLYYLVDRLVHADLDNASQFPEYCTTLVQMMNPFEKNGSIAQRQIDLASPIDAKICTIFYVNVEKLCNKHKIKANSLEVFRISYNKIFSNMIAGWAKAALQDNPGILFQEDPEEFDLFIKEGSLIEEDALIRSLAMRFFLDNDVTCHAEWAADSGYSQNGKMYLWIRRSSLQTVLEKIGFKLSP